MVASSIESTSHMPSTKRNRNHDLDETDFDISNLFVEYPELGNTDFSSAFHNRHELVTMQHNDQILNNLFSLVKSKSVNANGNSSFFS